MRRPRHLSPEERALWDSVARKAEPLSKDPGLPTPTSADPAKPRRGKPQVDPIAPFALGDRAAPVAPGHDLLPPVAARLAGRPVQMDAKAHKRMARGKLKPEARLDLHGMTLAEAHPELIAFILSSQQLGRRLVLVITGKGKVKPDHGPIPSRVGVLRHQVPQWLALPPLAPAVMEVRPAHLRHGGEGAYYVYLRRQR